MPSMITNRAFLELLASPRVAEATRDFRTLVDGGFVDVEGAIFFAQMFRGDKLLALAHHRDRTGYECAVNKLHVEDYLERERGREPEMLAVFAKVFAEHLASRLVQFSSAPFRIIGNVNGRASTLRFHQLRADETWLVDDLETYREEALFYLDVP